MWALTMKEEKGAVERKLQRVKEDDEEDTE
jgi:hypothetical protein